LFSVVFEWKWPSKVFSGFLSNYVLFPQDRCGATALAAGDY